MRGGEEGGHYQVPPSSPVNGEIAAAAALALAGGSPTTASVQPVPAGGRGSKPYIESGMEEPAQNCPVIYSLTPHQKLNESQSFIHILNCIHCKKRLAICRPQP